MQLIKDDFNWEQWAVAPEIAKIKQPSFYADELIDEMFGESEVPLGQFYPWRGLQGKFRCRPGEVTIYAGINGHGKSLLTSQVALGLMRQAATVLIASFEMRPVATLKRMVRQASTSGDPALGYTRWFVEQWTTGRMWIYDHHGRIEPRKVLAVLRYVRHTFGASHYVIDSLMKCGIGVEDYTGQKDFVNDLCDFAMTTGTHVHLVAHARKGNSERDAMDKMDIKGASEITDQVDNVLILQRNKRKEDAMRKPNPDAELAGMPDAIVSVTKQRHGDWEGPVPLWFNHDAMSYVDRDGDKPIALPIPQDEVAI